MAHKPDKSPNESDTPSPVADNDLDIALRAILYRADCPDKMVLGDYHLDLLSDAEQEAIREHLDHCPHCREALVRFDEFLTADDLPVAETVTIEAETGPAPDPGWRELMLDYGRAWLEQESGRWRQIAVALSNLGQAGGLVPALSGLMGEAPPTEQGRLTIAPTEANFELEVMVTPETTEDEATLCQVAVALTLLDHFGDFSGVQVTLLWGDTVQTQETDALGEVSFGRLPCDQLATMNLLIQLPNV